MNDLLELAIEGHGGMTRWKTVERIHLQLSITGFLFAIKGLPVPVPGMSGVRAISAGAFNRGIVNYNGSVWTWGNNTFGQLGDGTTAFSFAPKRVNAVSDAVAMAIGAGHVAVLRNDGAVYSFGRNTAGQLGTNTTVGSNLPVQAAGVGGVGNLNLGRSANR